MDKKRVSLTTKKILYKIIWWQVGLLAIAVSFLGKLSGGTSDDAQQTLYTKKLSQAPWAPPAWLFAPAWTLNNFFLLMGLLRILKNKDLPEKKRILVLQAVIWVVFFSFNYLYFRKKSTLLAAVWTVTDTALAWASFTIALKGDKKIAYSYLPLAAWTSFASTLAGYQALKNPDKFLGTPALLS